MINAEQMREIAEENKIKLLRADIESNIRKASAKGRTKITISGQIPACIIEELQQNGFRFNNGIVEW